MPSLGPDLLSEIEQQSSQRALAQLRRRVDELETLELLRMPKRDAARRLLLEHHLPDPDQQGGGRRVVSEAFVATLLAAADENSMRELVTERARLVRALAAPATSTRTYGKPLCREQRVGRVGRLAGDHGRRLCAGHPLNSTPSHTFLCGDQSNDRYDALALRRYQPGGHQADCRRRDDRDRRSGRTGRERQRHPGQCAVTWTTDLPTTQTAFHAAFLGVAMQRSRSTDTDPIRVATSGVFEMACAAATFNIGDLVGPAKDTGNALLNQTVAAVGAGGNEGKAVGRVANYVNSAGARKCWVSIVSTRQFGGPQVAS